jgi:hypothetical protein
MGTAGATAICDRLDRLARERVAEAWDAALAQSLGDDPTVYVLRRLRTSITLANAAGRSDASLAQSWGRDAAGAVVRTISRDAQDGENLVRFQDTAEFVASFATDLLDGRAWTLWYYGAFASVRALPPADALSQVLLENRQDLPSIIARLHRQGSLKRVLNALDPESLRLLWPQDPSAEAGAGPEDLRPLVEAAMAIVRDIGAWAGPHSESSEVLAGAGRAVRQTDWRDGDGPTEAVLALLGYLAAQGYVRHGLPSTEGLSQAIDRALAARSWLNPARLRSPLLRLVTQPDGRGDVAPPRMAGVTPRQRELLADLAAAARENAGLPDASGAASQRDALLLYAALVDRAPHWADDLAAKSMTEAVLSAWRFKREAGWPDETLHRIARGELAAVLATLPAQTRVRARLALEPVSRLGAAAIEVIAALTATTPGSQAAAGWLESAGAGALLVLRAVLDLRLHHLAKAALEPAGAPLQVLLAALAQRIAGCASDDVAVRLFAGGAESPDSPASDGDPDANALQLALLEASAGQRLLDDTLHIHRLDRDSAPAVLVGGRAGVYPFGAVLHAGVDPARIVQTWLDAWATGLGAEPDAIVTASWLADLLPATGPAIVVVPEAASDDQDERVAAYREEAAALREGLQALGPESIGSDAELTFSLMAMTLLRAWARWLRQFSGSSVPYLLDNFIRRPGRLLYEDDRVVVELAPRPLDIVLEMAGYFADLEDVPWLSVRRLRFRRGGA